jgi:hypothetical protein
VSYDVAVKYHRGTLPDGTKEGVLQFGDGGATFQPTGGADPRTWAWSELTLVFDPPRGRRGAARSIFGVAILGTAARRFDRYALLTAGETEALFELTERQWPANVVAQTIIDVAPAAAGRVSVDDRVLGTTP